MENISFVSLIVFTGQRDKPFVRDDEYDVRTPRPDLLNRPYASEYTGDYRDQYNVKKPLANHTKSIF